MPVSIDLHVSEMFHIAYGGEKNDDTEIIRKVLNIDGYIFLYIALIINYTHVRFSK